MGLRRLILVPFLLCALLTSCNALLDTDNTVPIAKLRVDPDTTCAEPIRLDASGSYDPDDSLAVLLFRWDWEGDGIWDTALTPEPVRFLPASIASNGRVALDVRDRHDGGAETTAGYWFALPVIIRNAHREVFSIGFDPCCYPTRTGGCDSCSWRQNPNTTALGAWSTAVRDGFHSSFIGAEFIWGIGAGREVNLLQVNFDICSPVLVRASNAGHRLLLRNLGSDVEIWRLPERTQQEREMILEPGQYHLRVDLLNLDERFRVDFLTQNQQNPDG